MKFLEPMEWCTFRQNGPDGTVMCDRIAAGTLRGMLLCDAHAELLALGIEKEEVEFVEVNVLELSE